jgi:hypothetical protein
MQRQLCIANTQAIAKIKAIIANLKDGIEYRDVKLEVECIQHAINKKRHGKK